MGLQRVGHDLATEQEEQKKSTAGERAGGLRQSPRSNQEEDDAAP